MPATWEVLENETAGRKVLLRNGYLPIPAIGKKPSLEEWQNLRVTEVDIDSWFSAFPSSTNTGILTGAVSAIDIDILDPELADLVEQMMWDTIGVRGMLRFGLPPKRASLFRTEQPFRKIRTPIFISPNGIEHKCEVLGLGQQIIVRGIHPDTGKPYSWHGGEPSTVPYADLPELSELQARKYIAEVETLLRAQPGWIEKKRPAADKTNGATAHNPEFTALYGGSRERAYAVAALQGAAAEVAGLARGGRNDRLNALSYRLGTLVCRGWIDRGSVAAALFDAAVACGLVRDDGEHAARATIESGLGDGEKVPHPDLTDANGAGTAAVTAGTPGAAPAAFPFEYASDFSEDTAPSWIIKNVIAFGAVTSWIGPPGSGKSLILGDIAIHLVSGLDWRGYKIKAKVGVLYFALERADLVKRRFRVQAKKLGMVLDALPFAVCREVINLMHPGCADQIVATIKAVESAWSGTKVGMIVVDTMSKAVAAGGGDENSARDTNIAHANLRRVLAQIEVHVALIGHVGKDASRGQRGSNASLADVDAEHTFGDGEVTRTKNNDGPIGRMFGYRIATVPLGTDDDGDEISIAIIADDDPGSTRPRPASRRATLSRGQRRAMELLDRALIEEGQSPTLPEIPYSVTRVVTREVWCRYCVDGALSSGDAESSKKAFRRAMQDLVEQHFVGVWRDFVWCAYD